MHVNVVVQTNLQVYTVSQTHFRNCKPHTNVVAAVAFVVAGVVVIILVHSVQQNSSASNFQSLKPEVM
jgi:anthranilate phosphoribosyltransferase